VEYGALTSKYLYNGYYPQVVTMDDFNDFLKDFADIAELYKKTVYMNGGLDEEKLNAAINSAKAKRDAVHLEYILGIPFKHVGYARYASEKTGWTNPYSSSIGFEAQTEVYESVNDVSSKTSARNTLLDQEDWSKTVEAKFEDIPTSKPHAEEDILGKYRAGINRANIFSGNARDINSIIMDFYRSNPKNNIL
jgi:hypothetical protein